MPTYGVTPTGFIARTFEDLDAELQAGTETAIGVVPRGSLLKWLQAVVVSPLADVWSVLRAVYNAADPDKAVDDALHAIAAINGTVPAEARPSTVSLYWTGAVGASVPNTAVAQPEGTSDKFISTEVGTRLIDPVPAWTISTAYVAAQLVTNVGRVYFCVTAGTSAGSGGPVTTSQSITDGTVVWRYLGDGAGVAITDAESSEDGPIVGAAGTINFIATPMVNVLGVRNVADAVLGQETESNEDLRIRRNLEVADASDTPTGSLIAAVSATGATNVIVFENDTDVTDVNGVPPHAVEILARGGDQLEIAEAINANLADGIGTFGNTPQVITDENGFDETINFSRPTEKLIYNTLVLTVDPDTFPVDGVTQCKDAIVAWGNAQLTGVDARPFQVGKQAGSIPGVLDITSNLISVFPVTVPVSGANIAIGLRELALYDVSRISITTNPGTP